MGNTLYAGEPISSFFSNLITANGNTRTIGRWPFTPDLNESRVSLETSNCNKRKSVSRAGPLIRPTLLQ